MSLPMDRSIDWLFSKVVMDRGSVYVIAWSECNLGSAGGTFTCCEVLVRVRGSPMVLLTPLSEDCCEGSSRWCRSLLMYVEEVTSRGSGLFSQLGGWSMCSLCKLNSGGSRIS